MKTLRHYTLELQTDPDGVWFGEVKRWTVKAQVHEGYHLRLFPTKTFEGTAGEALIDLARILDKGYSSITKPFIKLILTDTENESNVHIIQRDKDNTQWLRIRAPREPKK